MTAAIPVLAAESAVVTGLIAIAPCGFVVATRRIAVALGYILLAPIKLANVAT